MTFELEFEGSESFLQNNVLKLAKNFQDVSFNGTIIDSSQANTANASKTTALAVDPSLSTADIAAKTKVKSGRELTIAAMAKLYFIDKKKSFLRKEILEEMKLATNYYKQNHSASLSKIFTGLQKKQLIKSPSKNTYSLAQGEVERLKAELSIGD